MKRNIIVHIPFQILVDLPSGSQIRPGNIKKGFEKLGYAIDFICGYGNERKMIIDEIKKKINSGVKYEFLYSESSTEPTLLTEKHHIPTFPFLDFGFLKFCKKNNIPIGLFYTDVYWNFSFYGNSIPLWQKIVAKYFYKYDLKKYQKLVDVFYLPSLRMLDFVPKKMRMKVLELPPGAGFVEDNEMVKSSNFNTELPLNILYVGGIGDMYRIHKLMQVIQEKNNVVLTVCCRELEWKNFRKEYEKFLAPNIKIVHESGKGLEKLYFKTDVASLFIEPSEYRYFAMPIKLFEYIKFEKPIIATENTAVGNFVAKNNIGWTIPYENQNLIKLLDTLIKEVDKVKKVKKIVQRIKLDHTWEVRAKLVEKNLTEYERITL